MWDFVAYSFGQLTWYNIKDKALKPTLKQALNNPW